MGQNLKKWSRRNKTQAEDRVQDTKELFVQNELLDQKLEHEELREFVMSSLMDQQLQQEKHDWSNIEEAVVPLERNQCGHPLAGLVVGKTIRGRSAGTWMGKT